MTVKRQYSLPNCTLILEGLSDTASGQLDARPSLSILVSAECRFTGHEIPLSGGREFFEALVRAVSGYAQAFLSGVYPPAARSRQPELVRLQPLNQGALHRLSVCSTSESSEKKNKAAPAQPSIQVDLTTVQLFDLVEAVDQFFADTQTLPDISLQLQPLPKRYATMRQPLVKRAAPAAIGTAGLALAAVALFFMPVPEIREPKEILQRTDPNSSPTPTSETTTSPPTSETTASPPTSETTASPSASETTASPAPSPAPTSEPEDEPTAPAASVASPSVEELEATLSSAPEITESDQLVALERYLYGQVNQAWEERSGLDETLTYKVFVVPDGSIVGYEGEDRAARDRDDLTPLEKLRYFRPGDNAIPQEPIAQFKVVFTQAGVLQVSPWRGYLEPPGPAPKLTNPEKLESIEQQLYDQIRANWKGKLSFSKDLIYRVDANEAGNIADYEATNQPARDYVRETPLAGLIDLSAAVAKSESGKVERAPLGQFRVVFTPGGKLTVGPW